MKPSYGSHSTEHFGLVPSDDTRLFMQVQYSLVVMVKFAALAGNLFCGGMVTAASTHTHLQCCKVAAAFICGADGSSAQRGFCRTLRVTLLLFARPSHKVRGARIYHRYLSGIFAYELHQLQQN